MEVEPTMNPMSQTERIRTERTQLTCDHIATPEAVLIRIVLLELNCHRTINARVLVIDRQLRQLGDTYIDEGADKRFAALKDKDDRHSEFIYLTDKNDTPPVALCRAGWERFYLPSRRAALYAVWSRLSAGCGWLLRWYLYAGLGWPTEKRNPTACPCVFYGDR